MAETIASTSDAYDSCKIGQAWSHNKHKKRAKSVHFTYTKNALSHTKGSL